jgi:uncharacterized membrane protein YqgA involved in biofilm formation
LFTDVSGQRIGPILTGEQTVVCIVSYISGRNGFNSSVIVKFVTKYFLQVIGDRQVIIGDRQVIIGDRQVIIIADDV